MTDNRSTEQGPVYDSDWKPGTDRDSGKRKRNNHWVGLFLIGIGALLLLRQFGFHLPWWLFSWPMILVVVGLFIGAIHGFRDFTWVIIAGVGFFFLLDDFFPNIDIGNFILPVGVTAVGLFIFLGPRTRWRKKRREERYNAELTTPLDQGPVHPDDSIESVSVFGGVKKAVFSKNFKGGEIVNIFGGAEINLAQADFTGVITIEVVQMFGGTKLIVPAHWEVRTAEAVAIFGGVDDKRSSSNITTSDKVLVVRGTTIFGGLEIRSY